MRDTGLPLVHRLAAAAVVVIGEGAVAEARRRLLERAGGVCCSEAEAHHARLAFVALDDPRQAESAARRLRTKGLLVNVADRPELCDFTVPSVLERGPLLVTVATGGVSAGLAKHVRLRLEALLPAGLGALAEALGTAKAAMRQRWPDAADRRRALDQALAQGGPLDPFADRAADAVADWLDGTQPPPAPQTVEITLRSADPDDLTLREARWLGAADRVLHDPGVPAAILDRTRADAERRLGDAGGADHPGLTVIVRAPR